MSIDAADNKNQNTNSVYLHIGQPTRQRKFLLSPAPPPKHKRTAIAARKLLPPTPPHNSSKRTRRHFKVTTAPAVVLPRSPLSPRESFLNILDTPSPPTTINNKKTAPLAFSLNELGYNIAIETFYTTAAATTTNNTATAAASPIVPVTPRAAARSDKKFTPAKKQPLSSNTTTTQPPKPTAAIFGMNILSRQHTNTSSKPSSSSKAKAMPLHSRSTNNDNYYDSSLRPPMPEYAQQQRRGSLPTSSSSQNHPSRSNGSSSKSSSSSRGVDKDINKAQNKRYPLPLPYAAIIEMDQILGDGRSAQKVAPSYTPASSNGGAFKRGPTLMGPNGEVSTGRPYVGADGRVWRDREEELEYAGLLASTSSDALRRGSDDTNTSLDEYDEERRGRRAWAKFGASTSTSASASKNGATTYDRFQAAEHRLRMPHSATSSSEDGDEDGADEPWSPLVETHAAQHHFPSYVFPTSSKSSRASSSIPTPPAHSTSHSHGRAMPLPVSVNDFGRANGPVPHHHDVPRAKEDFLASAFAPVPPPSTSSSSSSNARRSDRERSKPPTSGGESRMTARRSSVQAIGRNEIVVPLPSLQPSSSSSGGSHSRQQPSTGVTTTTKEKSGFLGVFKKK